MHMLCSCEGRLNSSKGYVLPVFCLFGNVDTGDCYQKKLCNQVFIAAKKCIAINWKVGYPPTMYGRNVKLCTALLDLF